VRVCVLGWVVCHAYQAPVGLIIHPFFTYMFAFSFSVSASVSVRGCLCVAAGQGHHQLPCGLHGPAQPRYRLYLRAGGTYVLLVEIQVYTHTHTSTW
jgi:hypothetical protein